MDGTVPTTQHDRMRSLLPVSFLPVSALVAALCRAAGDRDGSPVRPLRPPGAGRRPEGAGGAQVACLDDLTTAGTTASGHTDPPTGRPCTRPGPGTPAACPGIQVDGYFPDTST